MKKPAKSIPKTPQPADAQKFQDIPDPDQQVENIREASAIPEASTDEVTKDLRAPHPDIPYGSLVISSDMYGTDKLRAPHPDEVPAETEAEMEERYKRAVLAGDWATVREIAVRENAVLRQKIIK